VLPHEVLVRIFSFLPRGALAVTPGRVCRAWAAAKADAWAASQPADDLDADVHPFFANVDPDQQIPFLPEHYLREAYGGASSKARVTMNWIAVRHGLIGFVAEMLDPRDLLRNGYACHLAARFGQLPVLRWMHGHWRGDGPCFNEEPCYSAAEAGQLETLILLRESSLPWDELIRESVFADAARGGSLRVMEWCADQGFPMSAWTCSAAARGGHRDAIVFLRQRGCEWDVETCSGAAYGGHLPLLRFLRREQDCCPWDETVCNMAAGAGRIDILAWARANGAPWSQATCVTAADCGQLAALRWLVANGCPIDVKACQWEFQWGADTAGRRACNDWLLTLPDD
jgi:hypothetical protein